MDQVDMKIQLLTQLNIQTLVAGVTANEGGEKRPLHTHLVCLYGVKYVQWDVLNRVAVWVTPMQLVKPEIIERSSA